VKAVIGFYGVYDMQAQWEHDQMTRPRDQITEKFLGAAPMTSRKLFFEASPLSYVTVDKNSTRYGREDDIVDPATQSREIPHRGQAGGLLRAHDRGAGRRPFLG
jgi:hypothetical protein